MIKFVLKIVKKILVFALLIVVLLLVAINIPFNFYAKKVTTEDYSNWMVETLFDDQLVIDIAMLGAHDAFTNKINYGSNIDFASASGIQTGIPGALIKGFSVKQSKTQVSDVAALLKHGIRYFDIRLTYNDREAEWYTSHTYFSEPFANILDSIVEFLAENPGEFLILDIQHVNGIEYDDQVQFDSLSQMMTDSGIFDFAYEEGSIPLNEVTYGDVTENKSKSGVILLSKFVLETNLFWNYGDSVQSSWANTDTVSSLFEHLNNETQLILDGDALTGNQIPDYVGTDSRDAFRVMQAVLTMQMTGEGILEGMTSWSLLTKARNLNPELISQPEFLEWLSAMPIVMVDYADSNYRSFNDDLMVLLIDFNENVVI